MSVPDAPRLRAILGETGLQAEVESRGMLAVVLPVAGLPAVTADLRRRWVSAARACGFSHLALEIAPPPDESPAPPA